MQGVGRSGKTCRRCPLGSLSVLPLTKEAVGHSLVEAGSSTPPKFRLPSGIVCTVPARNHLCLLGKCSTVAMGDAINIVVKPTAGGAKFSVSEVASTMTIAELKEKVRLGTAREHSQPADPNSSHSARI